MADLVANSWANQSVVTRQVRITDMKHEDMGSVYANIYSGKLTLETMTFGQS